MENKVDTNFKVLMTLMGLEIGGAETHVLELCKALKSRGVSVFVASNGGAYVEELERFGVVHFHVPLHNKKPFNFIKSYLLLKKIVRENEIKLIHAHARIPAFVSSMLAKREKIAFVTTVHWIYSTFFPLKLLTKWGEKSLAVSDDIKEYLIDNYKSKADNIKVTINGIDTEKFSENIDFSDILKEFSLSESCNYRIVYVSRMDKDRSLVAHHLIEAAAKLFPLFEGLEVVIVGGGNDFLSVKSKAEALNKKVGRALVTLTGSRVDINKFAAAARVFVGVSRAALEAMAAGVPVVIAGNEGYIGIFDESKLEVGINTNFCCRSCALSTPELLFDDLCNVLNKAHDQCENLGKYGRETIKKYYSVEKMAEDALSLYEWVRRPKKPVDIMISGYYGFNNNGDDAVLKAIVNGLKAGNPSIKILVLSKKTRETSEKFGVMSINRFNIFKINQKLKETHMLISGGGSLIQDLTSTHSLIYYLWVVNCAVKNGVKVMLFANGIGPVNRASNAHRVRETLNKVDLITLRDNHSAQILSELAVFKPRTEITVDAAFSLEMANESHLTPDYLNNKSYFCVAVRNWKYLKEGFEAEIASFCDYMVEVHNIKPMFIIMQPSMDLEITKKIAQMMRCESFCAAENAGVDEILMLIKNSKFVVGMRLHTIIYAVKMYKPVIGLVYDPKVEAIMKETNQTYFEDVRTICAQQLQNFGDDVMKNSESISKMLEESSFDFQNPAKKNLELAESLLAKGRF